MKRKTLIFLICFWAGISSKDVFNSCSHLLWFVRNVKPEAIRVTAGDSRLATDLITWNVLDEEQ